MASSQTEKGPNETEHHTGDEEEIPMTLPIEILRQSLDQLDNVIDLASVALTCREWRELINSCDSCWEKAFLRDYNQYNAKDYDKLPTWRQKYLSCRLDHTRYTLRDMRFEYSHAADTMGMLENELETLQDVFAKKLKKGAVMNSPEMTSLKERIARCEGGLDYIGKVCMRFLHETAAIQAKIDSLKASIQINA